MKISLNVLTILLLSGCSTWNEKNITYEQAQQAPSYGYIEFDFSKTKSPAHLREDETSYWIHYSRHGGGSKFVFVKGAELKLGIIKAYIPSYKGYDFRMVNSAVFSFNCTDETCRYPTVEHSVRVYDTTEAGGVWCKETEYRNFERFDVTDGCKDDWRDVDGIRGEKLHMGSVFITPHFQQSYLGTFTNRYVPGHQSAGS